MKRFTATEKWDDPWFWELSPPAKLLWLFLCDHCDGAGIIQINLRFASMKIGLPINEKHLSELESRLHALPCGKILIKSFIRFQHGTLSPDCKPHNPIFASLSKHGLDLTQIETLSKGYGNPLEKGIETLQVQVKEKDKEKEKVKEKVQEKDKEEGGTGGNHRFEKPTLGMVQLHAAKIGLPEIEAEKFFHYHETDGWRAKNGPMRSWVSAMATWKLNYYAWNQRNRGSGGNRPRLTVAEERNSHIIGAAETLEQIRERSKANETAEPPF